MRIFIGLCAIVLGGIAATASAQAQTHYTNAASAQKACPSDAVVWLNTKSRVYHLAGQRWYGLTRHGAYVCQAQADAAGDRETADGQ
jgi:hypothetical protein